MRTDFISLGVVMVGLGALGAVYRHPLTRFLVRQQGKRPLAERRSHFRTWLQVMCLMVAAMGIGAIAAGIDLRPRP